MFLSSASNNKKPFIVDLVKANFHAESIQVQQTTILYDKLSFHDISKKANHYI